MIHVALNLPYHEIRQIGIVQKQSDVFVDNSVEPFHKRNIAYQNIMDARNYFL